SSAFDASSSQSVISSARSDGLRTTLTVVDCFGTVVASWPEGLTPKSSTADELLTPVAEQPRCLEMLFPALRAIRTRGRRKRKYRGQAAVSASSSIASGRVFRDTTQSGRDFSVIFGALAQALKEM